MKSIILAAFALSATAASAADITPTHTASMVQVDSVETSTEGEFGWPITRVKVEATFGNACLVPLADELTRVIGYSNSYDTLNLTLVNVSDRICTREFLPVTVTIDMGTYTRPTDGLFNQVLVNGIAASAN